MDAASRTAESGGDSPSVESPDTAAAGSPVSVEACRKARRRRGYAALAVLLAVALALPVGVHFSRDADAPRTEAKAEPKGAPGPLVTEAEAARVAQRTGKEVEATARRTATATTWARPDGLLRTRSYSDTIRAKVGDGWKPVDTTLRRVDGGYAPKAVNDPLLFSAGSKAGGKPGSEARSKAGSDSSAPRASRAMLRTALTAGVPVADEPAWSDLVRLTTGPHHLVVKWPGELPEPVVDGPRALYQDVRPGIDLLLTARDSGFSHILIVKNREAAEDPLLRTLTYRLASPTLTFVLDPASKAVSARDSAGEEFAAAPTPYLWDSAGPVRATIGEPTPTPDPAVRDTSLALPGLAGPQPGSRDAVLDARLGADDGRLDITVPVGLLTGPDTVYPVFIDPSFKGRKKNWTLLYKKYPGSSFWNGQNFNDGTNEARVGYEKDSGGLSRSAFTFEFGSVLHGTSIKSADFRALQTYSYGCSSRQYNLHLTGGISSSSSWNNQPAWKETLSSQTNGHGYRTGDCPDSWVKMNIKSAVQKGADGKWSSLTLGLRAANETDTNAWKKFMANGENSPYIEVVHNSPPREPAASAMTTTPGTSCKTATPYPGIGKQDITFSVTGSDPDGNLKHINLRVYHWIGDTAHDVVNQNLTPNSSGTATRTIPWSQLTSGKTYTWTARTIDTDGEASAWGPSGTAAYCRFTVDHSAPNTPAVSSDVFPPAGEDGSVWSSVRFGTAGLFTFSANGSPDVKEYQYSFTTAFNLKVAPNPNPGGRASVSLKPPHAGPSVLYVRSVDATGNVSKPQKYVFNVTPAPVSDSPMDVTGDKVPDLYTIDKDGNLALHAKPPGTDRFHTSMPAAYTTGTADGSAELVPDGYWKGALITHNGDWLPGDGIQDLVARMPDGKLYLYPGDGYGGFDVTKRVEVLLPAGAPEPRTLRQILSVGDVTGDGRPDLLALAGADLWAFTGYTGASFAQATRLAGESWTNRDLVQVGHIAGDTAPDLVFRENPAGQLHLRQGRNAASGGLDLASIGTKAASAGHLDTYGASGWSRGEVPILAGTPDVNGDGLPEVWALSANGDVRVHPGRAAGLAPAAAFQVAGGTFGNSWAGYTAIG